VHPNLLWLEPEEDAQSIKVDQIRIVNDFVNQSALHDGYRIVMINPANKMNVNAANALLKTLEEPSPESIFILISDQNSKLPATILSRCQRMMFSRPTEKIALTWLQQQLPDVVENHLKHILRVSLGTPVAALHFIKNKLDKVRDDLYQGLVALTQHKKDPINLAALMHDVDAVTLLDLMLSWMIDLLRLQVNDGSDHLVNHDYIAQLTALKSTTEINRNREFMDYLQELRTQICSGLNMNKQLMLEYIMIRWMEQSLHVSR
jgi:DNA polymerase-3 subunit delta'